MVIYKQIFLSLSKVNREISKIKHAYSEFCKTKHEVVVKLVEAHTLGSKLV